MSAVQKRKYDYDYGYGYETKTEHAPELRVLEQKRIVRRKRKSGAKLSNVKNFLMISLIFFLAVAIVYNYAIITEKKSQLLVLDEKIENVYNQIDEYDMLLESLNDTNNIESAAKSYLGMNYPSRSQRVYIDGTIQSSSSTDIQFSSEDSENKEMDIIDEQNSPSEVASVIGRTLNFFSRKDS